jgi:Protein of unknown function (DUF4238)
MRLARKHHYVPQMYLSGFANANGQCFVFDAERRRTFTTSPANIAAERDYNAIEADGIPPDALEKELAKLEGALAPAIKRVRETASFGKNGADREDAINLITSSSPSSLPTKATFGESATSTRSPASAAYRVVFWIQAPIRDILAERQHLSKGGTWSCGNRI